MPDKQALGIWVIMLVVHVLGKYLGGRQNYGRFLDPYYNTAPNI